MVFSQNHDHVGNRMLGERTSQLVSFEMQKLMAGAVITSPYIPMLFMGEEYAESNPFFYFVSHTDPDLVEAVRKGRKAEFAAFHAAGEAPDPQAETTFRQSKLQWDVVQKEPHSIMFRFYQSLLSLRKQHPALSHLERKQLQVEHDEQKQILALHRWHDNRHILCLMNFSKEPQTIVNKHGKEWKKVLNSADLQWKGSGSAPDSIEQGSKVNLNPESFLIYSDNV